MIVVAIRKIFPIASIELVATKPKWIHVLIEQGFVVLYPSAVGTFPHAESRSGLHPIDAGRFWDHRPIQRYLVPETTRSPRRSGIHFYRA